MDWGLVEEDQEFWTVDLDWVDWDLNLKTGGFERGTEDIRLGTGWPQGQLKECLGSPHCPTSSQIEKVS